MRVFLDVGAHEGQTLQEVINPAYRFDRIYAFEPMPRQHLQLVMRYGHDPRVALCNYGLAANTGNLPLYGTNEAMEASIHPGKVDVDATVVTVCRFLEASEFFARYLTSTDEVVMKVNCEGAEVDILTNLLDTGEIWKVADLMVDFDVRKVPGLEHQERTLLARFADEGFTRYHLSEEVMRGETHQERIAHWLSL